MNNSQTNEGENWTQHTDTGDFIIRELDIDKSYKSSHKITAVHH